MQKKKIKVLPHEVICPDGMMIEANPNESILDACLRNGLKIEHACEKACACTTCHVIIKEGFRRHHGERAARRTPPSESPQEQRQKSERGLSGG